MDKANNNIDAKPVPCFTETQNSTLKSMIDDLRHEDTSFSVPSVDYVQSKVQEFSNSFNSCYILSLLNCEPPYRESLIYLLISLKKNIRYALEDLGKSLTKRKYNFRCGLCDEDITVEPGENIWSSLQEHEHFEELYYKFMNGQLEVAGLESDSTVPVTSSESESNLILEDVAGNGDSNTDSGIEQQEVEPSTSGAEQISPPPPRKPTMDLDEDVNSFRFNFSLTYDEAVEIKLYPSSMMQGIRRYDKVKDFTIQRVGNSKASCLICHCEMNGMRVTKHMLVSHAMGQRHLKAAVTPYILEMLQFYHEFWLRQEVSVQAHQVYFRPFDIPNFRCTLCHGVVPADKVVCHIISDSHRKKMLEMYERRANIYFLINLQIQCYGITQEQFDEKESEFKQKEEVKFRERKQRKSSDSDTPDEQKKLANQGSPAVIHNIIKSVQSLETSNPLDCLPNRMKGEAKFFKKATNTVGPVHCNLCKTNVPGKADDIVRHIVLSASHVVHKKDKYNYYCEICNVRAMNEVAWQNHDFGGPRHTNMAESRKAKVTEYECTNCKTIIFGDELSLTRHLDIGNRGRKKEKGSKLPDQVKVMFKTKEHILAQGALLAGDAEEVLNNSLTRDCCARIESALLEQFAECKVYPFGSRISGIGNKGSDLDVFVDIGDMYYGERYQEPPEQVMIIRKANKSFTKTKEFLNIIQVLTARTPILKLHHKPTNLDCDLSFKHGLSVENTKFLRFCIQLQPVIQPLIILIKKWSEFILFDSVSTYAMATLCIFFMQVNGYLLSVDRLRKINNGEHKIINGWKTINYILSLDDTKTHIKTYPNTVNELLKEFFEYYAKFDFNSYVACPLLGRVVKRTLFDTPHELPAEMNEYTAQLENENGEIFKSTSYMCIQDPFDLSHNLTKVVQQGTVTKFQNMCKLSVTHLESIK